MVFKGEGRENRVYAVIAIIVIVVIIITVLFSANQLTPAYVENDDWINIGQSSDEQLLGLEKQVSFLYENKLKDNYTASITVTTFKTLFMMNEEELLSKTIETIKNEAQNLGIVLDDEPGVSGTRSLNNTHQTRYMIYYGNDTSKDPYEKIKIIGETWNCGRSATSVICIGVAQITDNAHNNPVENLVHWAEIISDKDGTFVDIYGSSYFQGYDGLIFNVKCH